MIDIEIWDKEGWKGAGFLYEEMQHPTLLLPFTNKQAAEKIFGDWIKFFGKEDENENIRIAIVEGGCRRRTGWL